MACKREKERLKWKMCKMFALLLELDLGGTASMGKDIFNRIGVILVWIFISPR